ncbi:MAG: hypothetical protein Q7R47_06670 [Candidatus Diapherotrites archaeon]|nr:hypothetical protein [Candidatus Diapherotrites archaeon]
MLVSLGLILVGFLVLSESAKEAIVRLVRISRHFGLSEFSISFLVVGAITILPELAIGLNAAADGASSFGLGIVLGSNVADLLLVMGLVALATGPVALEKRTLQQLKYIIPLVVAPILLLSDGMLSRLDGFILLGAFAAYVGFMLMQRPQKNAHVHHPHEYWARDILVVSILVLVMLVSGNMITDTAESLSRELALPLVFIGTLLAVGTCMPELLFALRAGRSHHVEMSVGDVFGNVVADCLLALGLIAVISPIAPQSFGQSMFLGICMLAALALVSGLFYFKGTLSRRTGAALVLLYVAFLVGQFLFEQATVIGMPLAALG